MLDNKYFGECKAGTERDFVCVGKTVEITVHQSPERGERASHGNICD